MARKKVKSPRSIMVRKARQRAKEKGLECDISTSDIVIPDVCPVLGIPLFRTKNQAHDGSPSLDRIDNNRGYVRGNIRVISYRANSLKSNASMREMELVLEDMRKTLTH